MQIFKTVLKEAIWTAGIIGGFVRIADLWTEPELGHAGSNFPAGLVSALAPQAVRIQTEALRCTDLILNLANKSVNTVVADTTLAESALNSQLGPHGEG